MPATDAVPAPIDRPALVLFSAAALFSLTPWASPAVALALGAAVALTRGNPFPRLTRVGGKWLLQGAVVGLGFGMPLSAIASAGRAGIGFTVAGIATALTLGLLLGRALRVERQASFLIAAGTSICGGSAIAALGPAIGAEGEAMSVALGTVFVLNGAALYLFPAIGHQLHLSQHQFAIWAAVAIHDTSSVVGAASSYGPVALQQATVLKLARALWIVPLTLGAAAVERRRRGPTAARTSLTFPWFIGLFLVAALIRTLLPPSWAAGLRAVTLVAHAALVLTLFLIGAGLTRATFRSVGARPLVQGVLLWAAVGGLALLAVRRWAGG